MNKSLSKLSNEELWQLFPIIIMEHDKNWSDRYKLEKQLLTNIIGEAVFRINHIGSTYIPDLPAKPTIDILIEVNTQTNNEQLIKQMESIGYIYTTQPDNPPPHMMFMKGYTMDGFKGQAFHVHVRYPGDWDELYFRDYLLAYPKVAKEYGELKLKLKEKFEHNRDGYTIAKTSFIRKYTTLARSEFSNRYQF